MGALTFAVGPEVRPPPSFEEQLDYVEYNNDGENVEIIAYDAQQTVIGVMVMWFDADDNLRMSSEFEDGIIDIKIADGIPYVDSTLTDEVLRRRSQAMVDGLSSPDSSPQEGWAMCGAKVAAAVVSCNGAGLVLVLGCPTTSFMAACECIPLVIPEDWEYDEC